MTSAHIQPSILNGEVTPPPSKSIAHRILICAALAKGKSIISPFDMSDDMEATIGAVKALGASVTITGDSVIVDGTKSFENILPEIDCLESGSTLRFMIPVAAAGGAAVVFKGRGRLPQRPVGPYLDCLPQAGVECITQGGLPLSISGQLRPGVFTLPGNVSSQFVTGLLLALPLLNGDSEIVLTSPLESAGYVDITIDVMQNFGVYTKKTESGYFIKGGQTYCPGNKSVEGDWSQAAFWLVAGALGSRVACRSLTSDSKQGDMAIADILRRFGANVEFEGENTVTAYCKGDCLYSCEVDASQIPDLVPAIAVAAALSRGRTVIKNAARLRIKESDRLKSTAAGLNALGAHVEEQPDGLVIEGVPMLCGGTADACGDHRIAMALSIAALRCKGKVTINGANSITKSYPAFFEHYNKLGGKANVVNLG